MTGQTRAWGRVGLAAAIICPGLLYIAMYQLASTYSRPEAIDSIEGFRARYYRGIYAYRIAAREALLALTGVLGSHRF